MCGIAGYVGDRMHGDSAQSAIKKMAHAIQHRGPDDNGCWLDAESGVVGHSRLSILDLSPAGHQPMHSMGGRYVVAFNGEIYNHLELRSALHLPEGSWRGHSDTETLLAAFEAWGVETTLSKAVGMFAIALWDREARTLFLARDRFGEKPLYYGWVKGAFVFRSELKALRAYPGFDNAVCRDALTQYLQYMYVPAPRSIYQGIYKLEQGCLLTVKEPPPFNSARATIDCGAGAWFSFSSSMVVIGSCSGAGGASPSVR